MSQFTFRRPLLAYLTVFTLVASLWAAVGPAGADHTPSPERVTLMGSLMQELGCGSDWDEGCTATDLIPTGEGQVWELIGEVPAGTYEFEVRLNGAWTENYGADGQADGANIPVVLLEDATLQFTYDHDSHRVAVAPADPAEPAGDSDRELARDSLRADLTEERFYFVMADRFANGDPSNDTGGFEVPPGTPEDQARLYHGFDPTDPGFFHGGDLPGILDRLDYIEGLGTTAIWLTPSFENKPVQGDPGSESAGYHGYWITDFTQIDPHLGTNDDMVALVDAAHDRGIKVFFDIITNHTADVITYDRDAYDAGGNLPYVSTEEEPYRDASGEPFDDRVYADGDPPFPPVDLDSFPYRPLVPSDEADVKFPDWLDNPLYYHNRGTSTFAGESNTYGDFPSGPYSSLDDLWTEHPQVIDGMIDIYQTWVREVGIDGFRIDTVKHVNTDFWKQFGPALTDYADTLGNDDFFMFAEVFDSNPEFVSHYTTEGRLQAAVDFGFQGTATGFAKGGATTGLRNFFASDDWFIDDDSNAYSLPTFLGNHDMGRIGSFLREDGFDEQELLARDQLAHTLMYLTRGQPVVYYGDEQGFSAPAGVPGGPGDRRAREDMFPSQVPLYNSYDLIGTDATTAQENYDPGHPMYDHIAALAALREAHPALADGAQVHRYASSDAGIYAFSRVDADEQIEYVVAINNATTEQSATFDTFSSKTTFRQLWPDPAKSKKLRTDTEGRVSVTVPPLSEVVYRAERPIKDDKATPAPFFSTPTAGGTVGGRAEIGVSVPSDSFTQVTLAWRPVDGADWTVLGTDDNAPYRVFHDVTDLPTGTMLEYRAVAKDADGDIGVAQTYAFVGEPTTDGGSGGGGGGPVTQPDAVSVPGSFNSEVGCPDDWQPDCPQIDLSLDAQDLVWMKTFQGDQAIPPGGYAYKVAINDSWEENYGGGAERDGPNIDLTVPDGTDAVTFYYSHQTNWVADSVNMPNLFTAPGSYQSEIGCPGDWQPDCLRSWLQDPDGDDVWTFTTEQIPAGSYEVKIAQNQSWDVNWGADGVRDGANIAFTVNDGEGVEFSFDEATKVLSVSTFPASGDSGGGGGTPDLSTEAAHWLTRQLIAWDLPNSRQGWTYRLHTAPKGGLAIDAEAITGGTSVPLSEVEGGLPAALAEQYPHLAGFEALGLDKKDAKQVEEWLTGQLAVAAYDDLGRLRAATGVQIAGVLDDVYADAATQDLGVTWRGPNPSLQVWAPTAKDVDLLIGQAGRTEQRVKMRRDDDGVWSAKGTRKWEGARYAYEIDVYVPAEQAVVTNVVTDPYSVALTTDSARSVIADLDDPALKPRGWDGLERPELAQPEDSAIYELHVRDFSITDETVPAEQRGTYLAFTQNDSAGMRHLRSLADAGLNTVHLLPTYDLASIPEDPADQQQPPCDLSSYGPASPEQQACIAQAADTDGFNWGYDPWHYTTPEGSYSTDPDGTKRTLEYRQMVQALNSSRMRVVADVVYNHTFAAGQDDKSVLDRIVPGYYHRRDPTTGEIAASTCCPNTATEHRMMEKLMVDSVVTWARDYKIDGFRFDLMGHHSLANMQAVREALDALTVAADGVDGAGIYLYGEGWNFGEVADNARFVQATQQNLAGTGIGSFNDRMRDAVHGGSPFDTDPRQQGFGTGLFTDSNGSGASGDAETQEARLLYLQDRIKIGLAGNLRDYSFIDRTGQQTTGGALDATGYAADPSETVNYVDAHDNETLFDLTMLKMDPDATTAERARMNTVSQATVALSQGVAFWHAGTDVLRSKSLDRNSYNSGDWFNRVDWSYQDNTFGSGLPPEPDNGSKWDYMRPLLERADELRPTPAEITATHERAEDLLRLRYSSPLFRLGDAEAIQQRVTFPDGGPDQPRGVIVMRISDQQGTDLDPRWDEIVVIFNATPDSRSVGVADAGGLQLHPVQAGGSDDVVKATTVAPDTVEVPARTVAVLVRP